MTIVHHPDDSTLMSFAAGSLPEALSAVVATHLVACPACRGHVRNMDDIGAALFATLPPAALSSARATNGRAVGDTLAREAQAAEAGAPLDPILRLAGVPLADVPWKRLGLGVWHYPISLRGENSGDLRLIKVQRNQAMPEHGHGGSELTLVLDGAYSDEIGRFAAGDVADLDDTVEHRPIADAKTGCICLIASEHKARFTGILGRLLQPFAGI